MSISSYQEVSSEVKLALSRAGQGKTFLQNGIVRSLLLISFGLTLLSVGFLVFLIRPSDALSVLHYNVYFGVDLLGAWWQTFLLPGVALIFALCNTILAERLYTVQRERIAAYLLLLGSAMLLAGSLLGCIAVGYINY